MSAFPSCARWSFQIDAVAFGGHFGDEANHSVMEHAGSLLAIQIAAISQQRML